MKSLIIGLVIYGLVMLFTVVAETPQSKEDLRNYEVFTNIKASLLPVQAEVTNKDNPPSKQLSELYDKAASAFNNANEAYKLLQLAIKLGQGETKARKSFIQALDFALTKSSELHFSRGIVP